MTVESLLHRAQEQRPLPHGGIILAATPLGNPLDASIRLLDALASADIIAAEDTRRTRALADALGVTITGTVVSNFDHNESDRAGHFVAEAQAGKRILVVTDAGMPAVSDPGFPLVVAARAAGVPVTCLPGPSAVPTALALSGVGMGHFTFLGFAPRKDGARREFFSNLLTATTATCFFESPHRLQATLDIAVEILGARRPVAVARELTKRFEEVRSGSAAEVAEWAHAKEVKGEICVVIGAVDPEELGVDTADVVGEVEGLVAGGMRLKAAAGEIAKRHNLSKREVYEAVLHAREEA
ncbi:MULTISPECIES: 16S rRNA (cytidine(1402)-2'-O)-methyltransferase [Corynebacterium]|uniref:16S rRNA (cytidine(1402)-2'-O)-methyltransferase n=1 Tax=Corynebacterium TaxID=1716 RepID=UPI0008A5AA3C|nr:MULTISPECIES: 16S rRNA (cytidine(1402)-2'-O)-methyltransferase [Corynebacterium]OFT89935.1 rRNA (cytidine-2'-O-)-methyltransferase [Corynebacterium sp. HMSC28B08]